MGKSYSFVINGELCDLNQYVDAERSNRFQAATIKKEMTAICYWNVIDQNDGRMITSPVKVHFLWCTKDERKDPDNVAFAKKFILDAMVKAGVLKNDGRKQIKGLSDSFDTNANEPKTVVTLEEV